MRLGWPTVLVKVSLKYLTSYFSIENYIFIEIKMLYGHIYFASICCVRNKNSFLALEILMIV